jgi:hypothetical protein
MNIAIMVITGFLVHLWLKHSIYIGHNFLALVLLIRIVVTSIVVLHNIIMASYSLVILIEWLIMIEWLTIQLFQILVRFKLKTWCFINKYTKYYSKISKIMAVILTMIQYYQSCMNYINSSKRYNSLCEPYIKIMKK